MKILIVEDEPIIALDMEQQFRDAGHEVVGPVSDVESAIDLIGNEQPDCASLDFDLGAETSQPIARLLEQLAIAFVFVTGRPRYLNRQLDVQAKRILTKPIDPKTVLNALTA